MNTTVFLFLFLCSSGILLIIFVFFLRITAATYLLGKANDPWKQFQAQSAELLALVDQYTRKYYCLRLPKEAYNRLNYKLLKWQDNIHHLDQHEREKADQLRKMLYQKASSAGIRLSSMFE